ncbi:hypothetical protein [Falsibacillus pallidus]|uniref:Uncharacterized protein n=1 Tax=Falsibacillus pallidus TaxID=493781 RepID=A0A370GCN1_9BACI|nr:hypothetical protein [Falsibacillus pallidus]RDI41592.1 hypothetical protein DFR59_10745 [Falsibacillus pallidus]
MLMVPIVLLFFILSGICFYLVFIKPAEPDSVHFIPAAPTPPAISAEAAHSHG